MTEGVEIIAGQPETILVEVGLPGPPGRDGADGAGSISTDPDNRLTVGGDGGLYVADALVPDPLAWYILAKS